MKKQRVRTLRLLGSSSTRGRGRIFAGLCAAVGLCLPSIATALTVSVTGPGQIVSIPAGITCGNGATTCTATFVGGTNVLLAAVASPGNGFSSWGGACAGIDLKCLLSDATGSVSASFANGPQAMSELSAGDSHTCALTADGAAECWGFNSIGQIGNGTTTDAHIPTGVSGLTSGVVAVAAGGTHTCALTSAGAVLCWGSNGNGQLGASTAPSPYSLVPVAVTGLSPGVVAIAAGFEHTCALTSGGAVLCWGSNGNGQLGASTATLPYSLVPVAVTGLTPGVVAIAVGFEHTCALTSGGAVLCWGANTYGQLGNNSSTDSHVPFAVSGLTSGVTAISAGAEGYHTCALTSAGGAQCWGANFYGQLGSTSSLLVPVPVSGLATGATAIGAGANHTCASTSAGAMCWGYDVDGELGNNTMNNLSNPTPVPVTGLTSGVAAVAAGGDAFGDHSCALMADGSARCWGRNANGQLGNNTTIGSPVPVCMNSVIGSSDGGKEFLSGRRSSPPFSIR